MYVGVCVRSSEMREESRDEREKEEEFKRDVTRVVRKMAPEMGGTPCVNHVEAQSREISPLVKLPKCPCHSKTVEASF